MKKLFYLAIGFSAIAATSCKENKTESTTVVTPEASVPVKDVAAASAREGKVVVITDDKVPEPVRVSFTKKYPKVLSPQWVEYTPVEDDQMPMDETYYYVTFNDRGTDITSWYDNNGEWVKTSTIVTGDSRLPDAVNKTLNEQYPDYTIEEVSKENDKDMDMYQIKLNKGDAKAKLKILPNGEIFKRKTT